MTPHKLVQKQGLTNRIAAFMLVPAQGDVPHWDAGAHVEIALDGVGTRSYSLIRWPDANPSALHIAVQAEGDGDGGSLAMHAVPLNQNLAVSAPKNSFQLRDDPAPVALIAGGIGVTPLISMATDLSARDSNFVFHYAGRTRPAMAYVDALAQAFGAQVQCHFDDETPLDLDATIAGLAGHQLYICGPKGMIDAARRAAETAGIPAEHVHVELFATPETPDGDSDFEVEIASTGEVVIVPAGRSIIDVLEDVGHDVMYDCQRGDCGICQVDVIEGTPDHRDVVLSEAEKASGKVMQICVSRAKSARLKLEI